jgi:hypothetical protein
MKIVAFIGWILLGFIQLAAMLNGLSDVFGKFFGFIIALILGELPIIGTILGIRGAIVNWNWPIWKALALFIGAPIAMIFLMGLGSKNDNNGSAGNY